jgi:hypothetical protein
MRRAKLNRTLTRLAALGTLSRSAGEGGARAQRGRVRVHLRDH